MTVAYFDASALVKLLVQEDGSAIAEALWDGCDAAASSRLAHPEVCSALAAAGRNHDLTARAVDEAFASWGSFWAAIRAIEANETHYTDVAGTPELRRAGGTSPRSISAQKTLSRQPITCRPSRSTMRASIRSCVTSVWP